MGLLDRVVRLWKKRFTGDISTVFVRDRNPQNLNRCLNLTSRTRWESKWTRENELGSWVCFLLVNLSPYG